MNEANAVLMALHLLFIRAKTYSLSQKTTCILGTGDIR